MIGFDRDPVVVQKLAEKGAISANSLDNIISQLKPPPVIWLMVPAGDPVDPTIAALVSHLAPGDTIIDGGNSYYKDSMRRAAALERLQHDMRFRSQDPEPFANKLLAMMRHEFGGHAVKTASTK